MNAPRLSVNTDRLRLESLASSLTVACATASLLVDENILPDILPVCADAVNAEKLIAADMKMRLPNTSFLIHANYKSFRQGK